MTVEYISCTRCGGPVEIRDPLAQSVQCPFCNQVLPVPEPSRLALLQNDLTKRADAAFACGSWKKAARLYRQAAEQYPSDYLLYRRFLCRTLKSLSKSGKLLLFLDSHQQNLEELRPLLSEDLCLMASSLSIQTDSRAMSLQEAEKLRDQIFLRLRLLLRILPYIEEEEAGREKYVSCLEAGMNLISLVKFGHLSWTSAAPDSQTQYLWLSWKEIRELYLARKVLVQAYNRKFMPHIETCRETLQQLEQQRSGFTLLQHILYGVTSGWFILFVLMILHRIPLLALAVCLFLIGLRCCEDPALGLDSISRIRQESRETRSRMYQIQKQMR